MSPICNTRQLTLALYLSLTGCLELPPPDNAQASNTGPTPITEGNWLSIPNGISWQWQLSGDLNTGYVVDLYDIDLFDTPQETIDTLQAQGKMVICYFSAGSWEDWRSDADQFDPEILGNTLQGWPDEKWLDIRRAEVLEIMVRRLDLAAAKNCDGVELDNVDGHINDTGFNLTVDDVLLFNKQLANEARKRNLAVGLKNNVELAFELEPYFDFSVNEQCHEYNECIELLPFKENNKAILNAEYDEAYLSNSALQTQICNQSKSLGLSTLFLPLNLDDSFRIECGQ